MEAVILAWTTAGPQWSGAYVTAQDTVRKTGIARQHWLVTSDLPLSVGMDVWLLVVDGGAAMRGVVGHGTLARIAPVPREDGMQLLDVDFDLLLQHGDQVPFTLIEQRLPGLLTGETTSVTVDGSVAAELRRLWTEAVVPDQGWVEPPPGALPSRLTRRISADRVERDPDFRRTALAHRGSACHACGLDMEQTYGEKGRDLVQVHHLTPLAHRGAECDIDPLIDLVPLCPTCHVVAHSRWPDSYSVEEIRAMLREGGFMRGTIMTKEQLEAESAAARILRG
ncbi:MAG: hypothetical protein JWM61_2756 [Micrococcaceae bacterium]|nr:hypothetical protein [Micrococcaceae bacterium]